MTRPTDGTLLALWLTLTLSLSGCALHSDGGSGTAGTSAGVGGSGGVSGVGGSGGTGGSMVECPGLTPVEGSACSDVGQCMAESSGLPGCRTIWECFEERWVKVFDNGCVGPSIDVCPATAEEAAGQPCLDFACVYPGAIVCACERPCSGIQPDPTLLRTVCLPAPRAVCVVPKAAGDACAVVGDACSPDCCGTEWTCGPAGWQDSQVFCPP